MPTTIRRGTSSTLVVTWQNQLNAWFGLGNAAPPAWTNTRGEARGFPGGRFRPLRLDGVFGAATELATEAWQVANGLEPDGIVGPATWSAALRAPVPGPAPLLYGVDVSAMQGKIRDPDWKAMRERGIRFSIARTWIGNEARIDAQAAANLVASRAHGIAGGFYGFSFPLPHIDPCVQVEEWIRTIERAGLPLEGALLALDLEWPPREAYEGGVLVFPWKKWGVTASSIADWNVAALERARELTGRHWLRYSFPYFLACIEAAKYPELADGPLWLADYWAAGRWPTPEEAAKRKPPAPWSEVTIFQHDGNGGLRLPSGVDADFNVLRGGEARLAELLEGTPVDAAVRSMTVGSKESAPPGPIMPDEMIGTYRRTRLTAEPSP